MEENQDGILECGAVYTFTHPDQFWSGKPPESAFDQSDSRANLWVDGPVTELAELLSVAPDADLDELDYALRSYIAFAAHFMGTTNATWMFLYE